MGVNWTQLITNLMLISGAAVVVVKGIDGLFKYFDKKKTKVLQESVEKLQKDVAEIIKSAEGDRTWMKKLEDDLDYLMKLLLDRTFKK